MLSNKSPILIAQNLINAVLGLLGLFFITRLFPTAWGILSFGIGFVGVFSLVGDLGFSTAAVRAHSAGESEEDVNSTYLLVKIVLGLIFSALAISSVFVWTDVLRKGFEYTSELWVIVELVPYYFVRNLLAFPQSNFTSKLQAARMGIPSILESAIRNGLFISIGVLYYRNLINIGQGEVVYILPLIYVVSFSAYFISSMILGRPWKFRKPSYRMFRTLAVIAIPLSLSMGLSTVNQNIDKVIIQLFWHAQATGAFYLNQRIAVILLNFSLAISVFFIPLLTRYMKEGDMKKVNANINDFERIAVMFILPFIIITFILSPFILNIFNGFYKPYALVLPLLALSALFTASYQPFDSALVAAGRAKTVAKVTIISVILNIVLDITLIPPEIFGMSFLSMGVDGAAMATAVASLYTTLHMRYYVGKVTGYRFRWSVLRLIVPGVIEIIFLKAVLLFVQPYPFVELVSISLVALIIFYLFTILTGETTFSEIKEFIVNLNPLVFTKHLENEKKGD
ncbi:MAG: polysaccharide biosynthesis C-terminal domain-containing protein [Candidatus Thermoplasmatota archaeon]|nr:polysaccharide biosynthesis C-terminal domain-containing protein [Candidatus Thermoplasmatota archaeon]MCL5731690.1 polysaccharide biosynthesis C-terminal domain-containing protein [Candidatus Thermoplasmatota archaeon]